MFKLRDVLSRIFFTEHPYSLDVNWPKFGDDCQCLQRLWGWLDLVSVVKNLDRGFFDADQNHDIKMEQKTCNTLWTWVGNGGLVIQLLSSHLVAEMAASRLKQASCITSVITAAPWPVVDHQWHYVQSQNDCLRCISLQRRKASGLSLVTIITVIEGPGLELLTHKMLCILAWCKRL